MISFDDLVDTGINTDEIENDLRNIRLNTQINRFSIIDCTNSIESLSSNTLALYNSLTTITGGGGGGFEYLEPFSAHSTESFIYNCNGVLSNQSFNETFKEIGPNINFDNVSFTTNQQLNLKGQTFNSCLIQSNSEHMILDYKLVQNGELNNNLWVNVSADEFKNNVLKNKNENINITGYINSGNNYSELSNLNIIGFSNSYNTYNSISFMNIDFNYKFMSNTMQNVSYMNNNYYMNSKNNYSSNSFINSICAFASDNTFYKNDYVHNNILRMSKFSYNENTYIKENNYSMWSNTYYFNGFININCCQISSNSFTSNSLCDIVCCDLTCNNMKGFEKLHLNCHRYNTNTLSSIEDLQESAFYIRKNVYSRITNYVNNHHEMASNSFSNLTNLNMTCYFDSINTYKSFVNGNFNIYYCYNNQYSSITNLVIKVNNFYRNKYEKFTYLKLDNCRFIYSNSITNGITLKLNCNDINTFSDNSFDSISEIHLKNAEVFNSTLSNTFANISSYYFKYTDGLYNGTDIASNLTSISNSAFIKYIPCSWLNVGGGGGSGGFDYWQSYDEHPLLGYNVSERLESDIINNDISGVGPAADFYDCTFQDKFVNLTGNEFNSNHIFNNKWYHNLDYLTFNNNSYEIISSLKINCDICSANTFNQVKYLDLTCIRPVSSNSFVSCTDIYIHNQGNHQIILNSCKNVNLTGGNFNGIALNNEFVKINCNNIESFNYSNNFNEISCYGCNSNTFKDCDLFSLTAFSMSNNTFNGIGDYKIKCHDCDGLTAEVRQFSIEGYNIDNCLLSSYNEGDVSSLWSHDVYLKAFYAESIRAFRISNLHLDISAYLLHANISNIGTLYLNYTLPFISEQKASSDTYLMNNVYIYSCSHFDFPAIGRVVNNGVYNWNNIPSQYVYINGVQLSKLM